jgi:hypothetical protein
MDKDRIVAVELLTAEDGDRLGPTFDGLGPLDETPCFSGLLERIDEADRQLRCERNDMPAAS